MYLRDMQGKIVQGENAWPKLWGSMVIVFLLSPMSAWGFNLLTPSETAPVRWLETGVPVFLDVRGVPGVPLEEVESAVLNALTTWNAVPCSNLTFRYVGLVTESAAMGVYIHWMYPGESNGVLSLDAAGVTETYFGQGGTIDRADMHLNQQFSWTTAGDSFDPTRVDIEAVIVHELGHAIGLGHSRDREATMYFAGGIHPCEPWGRMMKMVCAICIPLQIGHWD